MNLLSLPEEVFHHITSFLDLKSVKSLSITNYQCFNLTSTIIVNKSWITVKDETSLKNVYSAFRNYCNFKIDNEAESLDINDRRFQARTISLHECVLFNNPHVIKFIEHSKTLQNVFVDLGDLAKEIPSILKTNAKIIVKRGFYGIEGNENLYEKISSLFENFRQLEELHLYATMDEMVWPTFRFSNLKLPFKILKCSYLNSNFFEDILQSCVYLTNLDVQAMHYDKEQLPMQLHKLEYVGRIDGQDETKIRNSLTLENFLRNQVELKTVSVGHVEVTRTALQLLDKNEKLTYLSFYGRFSKDVNLEDFSCCSKIKKLYLHLSQDEDMENFYYMLRNLKEIENLDIKLPESELYLKLYEHLKTDNIHLPKLKRISCSGKLMAKILSEVVLAENLEQFHSDWQDYPINFLESTKELGIQNQVSFEEFKKIVSSFKSIECIYLGMNELSTEIVENIFKEIDHLKKLEITFHNWSQEGDDKNAIQMDIIKLIGEDHKITMHSNICQLALQFTYNNCSVVFRIFDLGNILTY